ncbi:sugar ABC transporter ATP-binding protein [Lysinimonas soli]|uniref:Sugar ABC transporter ATP-binding protein n=1 Tax=Lysinimonas soli TaxID=1074233 RepID=A0ABW0NQC0_9MICO
MTLDDQQIVPEDRQDAPEPSMLRVRNVSKTFGETRVLREVSLDIAAGETRGLVGENGSGKSTLIKVLAGFYQPDPGAEISVRGRQVAGSLTPLGARDLGLTFVHQDLALVPSLTVSDNMTVNALAASRSWRVSPKAEARSTQKLLDEYGLGIDARAAVSSLTQLERAMVAIVRAIDGMRESAAHGQAGLLVLDEPTVFLPKADRGLLFDLARRHTSDGGGVLFVSHDLEECLEVTDSITVLRDGRLRGTVPSKGTDRADIIRLMVGKELNLSSRRPTPPAHLPVVRATGLNGTSVRDVSLELGPGEIVGITGLLGSGFDELPYLISGAGQGATGRLAVGEREFDLASMRPVDGIRAGIALVPGDRARQGSVASLSVLDNLSVQALPTARAWFGIDWRRLRTVGQRLIATYDVRPQKLDVAYGTLSGGNQQKVLLARWMQTNPGVILLHEPTQGVDIGAREQIFDIVRAGADAGAAVLCASADQEQLSLLCDRVLVMRDGAIVAELLGGDISKAAIARESLGSARQSVPPASRRAATS